MGPLCCLWGQHHTGSLAHTACLPPTSMCFFSYLNMCVPKPALFPADMDRGTFPSIHCMHELVAHTSCCDSSCTSYIIQWRPALICSSTPLTPPLPPSPPQKPPPPPQPTPHPRFLIPNSSSPCSAAPSDQTPSSHSQACVGVAQVHYDIWRHPSDVQRRQSMSHNTSLAYRLLPQSLQDAYADGNARLTDLTNGQVSSVASRHTVGMQETKGHVEQESPIHNTQRCTSGKLLPVSERNQGCSASSNP